MALLTRARCRAALIVTAVALGGTSLSASGCGSDDPEPRPNDAGYPFDEARFGADGIPEAPELTVAQKRETATIARQDPHLREILRGHEARWGAVAPWSRGNGELLGGVIEIALDPEVDFPETSWPTIENTEELYGKQGPEGQLLVDELEPRVEPEVGMEVSSEDGILSLVVMVDLERGEVASVIPMPTVGI